MASPNGAEAGAKFLEENKLKEGVIVLPSGLQYKVLEEGAGFEHPQVGTPCECHYAGKLLDGSEFDSSYKRGTPTTFAPNQVIKGWTEAMQLMVVGDKWEMYIPYELAYGAAGKPPKIPAAATLIFVMEIIKIKGASTPKTMVYPQWSAADLALWLPKDETACKTWEEGRVARWEGGDAKLTASFKTRDDLDASNAGVSTTSKNKSLWRRTRAAKKAANKAPTAPAAKPALTVVTARELLTKALDTFKAPENKASLTALLKECEGADAAQAGMMKMMKMMPAITAMMAPTLAEYGFGADDVMSVTMQVQAFGGEDPTIGADVAKLMKAVQGDVSGLF